MTNQKLWNVVHVFSKSSFEDMAVELRLKLNALAADGWEIHTVISEAPGHMFVVAWSRAA
jgi:hypothetical protein